MTESAITNLQQVLSTKEGGEAFALDSAFLITALADPQVTVPANYDAEVGAAFQVESGRFLITLGDGSVGPVTDGSFTVTKAKIPLVGSLVTSPATLFFAVDSSATPNSLIFQAETTPATWTWTDSFPFASGFPFDQLDVSTAHLIFSTADGKFPYGSKTGPAVEKGPKQNFSASADVPDSVTQVLPLFSPPIGTTSLDLKGVLNLADYNAKTVLLPTGSIRASLKNGTLDLIYLKVADPSVALAIPPAAEDGSGQAASFSVSSGLKVGSQPATDSPYKIQIDIGPKVDLHAAENTPASNFRLSLDQDGDGPTLSPTAVIDLIPGGTSYFNGTAPVLQGFLTDVGLQGLGLEGRITTPVNFSQIAVVIGRKPMSWSPIPTTPGLPDFTMKAFLLQWSVLNPFDSATRQQTFLFKTQFTLAPSVFKGPGGEGDGLFEVQFTSGLAFYATFDGSAKLSDFLSGLSGGAVSLPSSIEAQLSNIKLTLDYNAKSFSFSSGFDLSLAFLEIDDKPIISITDGQVAISATTATQSKSGSNGKVTDLIPVGAANGTVWTGRISGLMAVGPLAANVSVDWDGTQKRWELKAALGKPISVQELINQFFSEGSYKFPDFLPGTLTISSFAIDAVIPSQGSTLKTSYTVGTEFSWTFLLGEQQVGISSANITIKYDGAKFSGAAEGTWVYSEINFKLLTGYRFEQAGNNTLYLEWQGFRAEYATGTKQLDFSLKGWTLGSLIQALVRTLGDPYFTLPSPWTLLNSISLDGLQLGVSLESNKQNRVTAGYKLSSPIDLGFVTIKELTFRRDTTGKVTLAIEGSAPGPMQPLLGNLMKPAGQDVQNMPSVPGRGETYFKVFLLVLGQRVGIAGEKTFTNTKDFIKALEGVPATTGKDNPVDPNSVKKGQPYYDQTRGWLIAGHIGLLKVAGVWTVDAMLVFSDPDLYGVRLELGGTKAGGLAGLAIDVLYKKITEDVGVFQIEFTFPDSIRNLDFGTFSITLPQLGIKIYTNGDFFIDVGFPYNLDFRRSFSIAAIVYGVPVLGSGGFYFGKLSSATATQIPATTLGTFGPVIIFGLGVQLGLGYNFTKGPLSAGFALTVFGIVEGVIAPWHPYHQLDTASNDPKTMALASGVLDSDYYFKLSGTAGVIGLLYGKIDFAIIQATVNVKITLSIQLSYESHRAILLVAAATVDVTVKVKIDCGLFDITISFSFSTRVSASFQLGNTTRAPWDDGLLTASVAAPIGAGPVYTRRLAELIQPRPKRVIPSAATKPRLHLMLTPPSTVLAPEGSTSYAQQQGALILLLTMDAPSSQGDPPPGDTSFELLCTSYFPWVIDLLGTPNGDTVDLAQAGTTVVSREQLSSYIDRLANLDAPPFGIADLLRFMSDSFTLDIRSPDEADPAIQAALEQGSTTLFPVFDGLSLSVPASSGGGSKTIDFSSYTTATSAYRKTVAEIFASVEAAIETQNQPLTRAPALEDDAESMSAVVFTDTFSIIGRQLLQAALDSLDAYAYHLDSDTSVRTIIDWAAQTGNTLDPEDVALPNQDHALSPATRLSVEGLAYTIQAGDTLASVATSYTDQATPSRWATTAESLVMANGPYRILQPGVQLNLMGTEGPVEYVTLPGDSFAKIAQTLNVSLEILASQSGLNSAQGLLAPTQAMVLPPIVYTTAGSPGTDPSTDTLSIVARQFATSVPALAKANTTAAGLFSPGAEAGIITLAKLRSITVSDLWMSLDATAQVAQTAGMVSRFLMYGLRLPEAPGLALSGQFLYPRGQKGYGLYQLTGQQFPTPDAASDFSVTVSRTDTSHGVDLSFVQFNGGSSKTMSFALTDVFNTLAVVVEWAKKGNFRPAPTFEALALAEACAKEFAAQSFSLWSTSDMPKLIELTDRGLPADSRAQRQPILWTLPPALTSIVQARQSALEPVADDVTPLLPQVTPQVGSTSPAGGQTDFNDIEDWAWATRVDFQVKKLPAIEVQAADAGAGSTPNGPASAPGLANVYEIVGLSSEQAIILERLLVAMHDHGEDIVSGVFLLYGQQQSGSTLPSLSSLGSAEFLSFITQTNLSTETNPERSALLARAAAGEAPQGIANSPGEFVRLLWELSAVRSGGYYLYFRVTESGDGLPSSIFDTSGSANLTMVATLSAQGPTSFGNTVADFVNSCVSTDPIDAGRDVVQFRSRPGSGKSSPLTGAVTESLASLSALYGAATGRIASMNSSVAIRSGVVIPMAGVTRQLMPEDLINPPQTLGNLAKYYSVGAETPITAQDISDLNPGVTVNLGAVFYIPRIRYVVAPATGSTAPGNTFASIAAYYRITTDSVALLVENVGALFAAGTVLDVDTALYEVHSLVGPRNLGIRLERENLGPPIRLPANPTQKQKDEFARATMFSLYSTLSAGLLKNPFFNESPLGLPFGPQDYDGASSELSAFASHDRRMAARRDRMASTQEAPYDFRQILGFGPKLATTNAAPNPARAGLPAREDNPYLGVGTTAQIALRWQDLFGNVTLTPFENPPTGYGGAINGEALPILYADPLIPVSAWPNVRCSYLYGGTSSAPLLEINLSLDATSYVGHPEIAQRDLKRFSLLYFQLHQNYTGLGVPGVDGNAVAMSLINSLLEDPRVALSEQQAHVIRQFVSDCVVYLNQVQGPEESVPAPPVSKLSTPLWSPVRGGNIVQLEVSLELRRQELLTDPLLAGALGLAVQSPISPTADLSSGGVSYATFATALETVFQTDNWYLKVGEGLPDPQAAQGEGFQLWAVRFGNAEGDGIYFKIDPTPSYYAPKPIAKRLASNSASLTDFVTGEVRQVTYTAVDQNLWFEIVLGEIDAFLSGPSSTSAFILDKVLGTHDPLKDGYLGKVLDAKGSLADSIASAVAPILSTSATDASTAWMASEKMRQQLLNQLSAAYSAGAVVVFGLEQVSGSEGNDPAGPSNLFGTPVGAVGAGSSNNNYTLSSARVPLGPTVVNKKGSVNTYDPRLTFVFTTKNVSVQAFVPLELDYRISYLEFGRTPVPGIDGYVQSQWLAFVNGPFDYRLGSDVLDIPVVNRLLPTPPTVVAQAGIKPASAPITAQDLARWDYSFRYLYDQASQDAVNTLIQLNVGEDLPTAMRASGPDLFTALAQFVTSYPAISTDFSIYLTKIGSGDTSQATIDGAKKAMGAFQQYVTDVATAYSESLKPRANLVAADIPELIEISFKISLQDSAGSARTDLLDVAINGVSTTWNWDTGTITAGAITLPQPVVEIQPDLYDAVPYKAKLPPSVTVSYVYIAKNKSDVEAQLEPIELTYEDALRIPERIVAMRGLDLFAHQSAQSSIYIERNRFLFPLDQVGHVSTTNHFIYRTPVVKFADRLVPRISYDSFSLNEGDTLESQLNAFFQELFEKGDGSTSVQVSMASGYTYDLQPGLEAVPRITLPISMLPPTAAGVQQAPPPQFTGPLASSVDVWREANHPTLDGAPAIEFALQIFGGTGAQQPLLVVKQLVRGLRPRIPPRHGAPPARRN